MALPVVIQELLECGVHFGHLSKHWNPKMKSYIFGKKKNVYIIDLEKTAVKLDEAKEFLKQKAQSGGRILFVGTKKQIRSVVRELAVSCNMPYVSERWVGGLLTNYTTVRCRINKYLEYLKNRENGDFEKLKKKEVLKLNREIERMEKIYSGVTSLVNLPDCVVVIDPKKETACVREVSKLGIPIVALIDTDANPEVVDYPVPGNDDSIKSVKYIVTSLVDAINEGFASIDKIEENVKTDTIVEGEVVNPVDELIDDIKKPLEKSVENAIDEKNVQNEDIDKAN
ncbi:MAG: 30S ribosomal protein S2 [Candidatus Omnitrophica bacterium]|nr:30S ribosomal protein S2 [Candidatus Omnitrophota bacterium]